MMTMVWDDVVLTVAQMAQADAWAMAEGVPGTLLMERAGQGVAHAIMQRWSPRPVLVLCGPGNNGGDGWVVARLLSTQGWPVTVAHGCPVDELTGDALHHALLWQQAVPQATAAARTVPLAGPMLAGVLDDMLADSALVVDALFGAGLSRPLDDLACRVLTQARALGVPVVAVDVPSGLHGDTAQGLAGQAIPAPADLTVTFMAPKPAHVLMPGRTHCGEVLVVDIGIAAQALPVLQARAVAASGGWPLLRRNAPPLWRAHWGSPAVSAHKYQRGHVLVFGGAQMVGAARLTSRAAGRLGAGLVTLAVPARAWPLLAATLMSTMAQPLDDQTPAALAQAWARCLLGHRWAAVALGPGAMAGLPVDEAGDPKATLRALVLAVLACPSGTPVVLDADALMAFEAQPDALFAALHARAQALGQAQGSSPQPNVVLTPHEGEFNRLFGGAQADAGGGCDKLTRTRLAAARSGAVVLHKGPDTVIAAPDGRTVVNTLAPVCLATAGSGDVLTGFIAALLAQGVEAWAASAAAAWVHGAAAQAFGPGLLADDLPEQVPAILRRLWGC